MKTYEYVFTAVILVAILLAATFLTSLSPSLYRSVSEVEQLKMAAQKVMAQVLLSPGEPEDWGENVYVRASDLSSFGLAVSTVFTREVFVLDPDKVQRLNRVLPRDLYIPPERFSELLGLGSKGYPDYGVRIDFIPALKVTISFDKSTNIVYVDVSSEQNMPIMGANVTLGAFYVMHGRITLYENHGTTNFDGRCTMGIYPNPSLLAAIVSYHGIQVMSIASINSHAGYLIGNHLLVKSELEVNNTSTIQVFTIFSSEGPKLRNVSCNISSHAAMTDYKVYDVGYVEPNIVAVVALTEDGGLIAAYKAIPESYSSAAGELHAPLAYMLERSVKIGFSTYTVRLKIWRMAW